MPRISPGSVYGILECHFNYRHRLNEIFRNDSAEQAVSLARLFNEFGTHFYSSIIDEYQEDSAASVEDLKSCIEYARERGNMNIATTSDKQFLESVCQQYVDTIDNYEYAKARVDQLMQFNDTVCKAVDRYRPNQY